jgi:hypothetical protein
MRRRVSNFACLKIYPNGSLRPIPAYLFFNLNGSYLEAHLALLRSVALTAHSRLSRVKIKSNEVDPTDLILLQNQIMVFRVSASAQQSLCLHQTK